MTYIKEDGTIYEVTTRKVEVDLDALKAELKEVEEETEPSDEELIEMGRSQHPYYEKNIRTEGLTEIIAKIEKDTKVIEAIK